MKNLSITIIAFLLLLILVNLSVGAAEATIAVTIVPQIEMLEAIAGERVEVIEMIPKGFSPANYSPSPSKMRAFSEASIYFSIGVPADMQNILPRAEERSDLEVVKLFERIEAKYPHRYFGEEDADHGHSHAGGRDPHIWLSPARTSYMVEIMRDELIELLPEYEAEFKENTDQYLEKLAAVDRKNKELLSSYKGEAILVYHPSFGYFTEHYGLKMLSIEKDGKEPGPQHLQEIIENAKEQGIQNVFYQAEIDSTKTRAVAEELGGEIVKLNPLAENYIENLEKMAAEMAAELAGRDGQ
ncbi:Zinc ABC transporter, periplasmic-binding protein ZnuA [Halanaerobium saccharolyticum subsp. saccharolyticum DSM 6643]|uniref:Zinc ABC transporter, periplasmic-binding protein ZnuA n=1 Tax=Halanaerobium saccharolyticum subsp. saccharolyticum DSM 6643 TaxID=1293054 RepID=M5E1J0_9FIRM|nr:zinc ABC transporter substrate-binding protein [Halanaerobium saccharolyticum]CCU79779.1 Zinc ABC transporter, periplasmic-binding protein ZnuA [Halanaerobium saccharolyticum subsp. saccharolyticum DSM 6643]